MQSSDSFDEEAQVILWGKGNLCNTCAGTSGEPQGEETESRPSPCVIHKHELKTDHTLKPKSKNSKAAVQKQKTEKKIFGVGKDILKYKKHEP